MAIITEQDRIMEQLMRATHDFGYFGCLPEPEERVVNAISTRQNPEVNHDPKQTTESERR